MLRVLTTAFAGLFGLAFGSFLNVCLSRWPRDESVVHPASHCRTCYRSLAWWENVPLVSWLLLHGRCRTCGQRISWRYPLVEGAIGVLWAICVWNAVPSFSGIAPVSFSPLFLVQLLARLGFVWLLVALAFLDAENLWLPDFLTWPGIILGVAFHLFDFWTIASESPDAYRKYAHGVREAVASYVVGIVVAAALVLAIRWIYWLIRRQEGIGLGDAKLMALLAAWLGLPSALLAFFFGVVGGATVAVFLFGSGKTRPTEMRWAEGRLPLGTFLCAGGVIAALWGPQILSVYLRWSGL